MIEYIRHLARPAAVCTARCRLLLTNMSLRCVPDRDLVAPLFPVINPTVVRTCMGPFTQHSKLLPIHPPTILARLSNSRSPFSLAAAAAKHP
jgi:hypothetical protein